MTARDETNMNVVVLAAHLEDTLRSPKDARPIMQLSDWETAVTRQAVALVGVTVRSETRTRIDLEGLQGGATQIVRAWTSGRSCARAVAAACISLDDELHSGAANSQFGGDLAAALRGPFERDIRRILIVRTSRAFACGPFGSEITADDVTDTIAVLLADAAGLDFNAPAHTRADVHRLVAAATGHLADVVPSARSLARGTAAQTTAPPAARPGALARPAPTAPAGRQR